MKNTRTKENYVHGTVCNFKFQDFMAIEFV